MGSSEGVTASPLSLANFGKREFFAVPPTYRHQLPLRCVADQLLVQSGREMRRRQTLRPPKSPSLGMTKCVQLRNRQFEGGQPDSRTAAKQKLRHGPEVSAWTLGFWRSPLRAGGRQPHFHPPGTIRMLGFRVCQSWYLKPDFS